MRHVPSDGLGVRTAVLAHPAWNLLGILDFSHDTDADSSQGGTHLDGALYVIQTEMNLSKFWRNSMGKEGSL